MILIEWITKPHYLMTPLDSIVMTFEIAGTVLCGAFIYEWWKQK